MFLEIVIGMMASIVWYYLITVWWSTVYHQWSNEWTVYFLLKLYNCYFIVWIFFIIFNQVLLNIYSVCWTTWLWRIRCFRKDHGRTISWREEIWGENIGCWRRNRKCRKAGMYQENPHKILKYYPIYEFLNIYINIHCYFTIFYFSFKQDENCLNVYPINCTHIARIYY